MNRRYLHGLYPSPLSLGTALLTTALHLHSTATHLNASSSARASQVRRFIEKEFTTGLPRLTCETTPKVVDRRREAGSRSFQLNRKHTGWCPPGKKPAQAGTGRRPWVAPGLIAPAGKKCVKPAASRPGSDTEAYCYPNPIGRRDSGAFAALSSRSPYRRGTGPRCPWLL